MAVKVKICGLTRPQDLELALELGADAVGFVLEPSSPRRVSLRKAVQLAQMALPFSVPVAVYGPYRGGLGKPTPVLTAVVKPVADVGEDLVLGKIQATGAMQNPSPNVLKVEPVWHGAVQAVSWEASVPRNIWRIHSIRIKRGQDWPTVPEGVSAVLVEAHVEGKYGGTGVRADLDMARQIVHEMDRPVIIAGGLNPDNVAEVIRAINPYAVDVSSGVEATIGKKDHGKLKAFFEAVRSTAVDK